MRTVCFITFIAILFLSCTVRPPLTSDTAHSSLAAVVASAASVNEMKGNGVVVFGQNGEEVSVTFDIQWAGDTAFAVQFYTILGMTVASVKSGAAGTWVIETPDTQVFVRPGERVRIGREFLTYSVTWQEFLTIITGRPACASLFSSAPDSQYVDGKNTTFFWKARKCGSRVLDITWKFDNKSGSPAEINYVAPKSEGWTIRAGGFKNYHAKEFRFIQSNNNYFYVKYHSMKFNTSSGKGKEF
jgi:hypothetical protein